MDPFNGTPRENRLTLAKYLRDNVTDDDYDHTTVGAMPNQPCCSLGHAQNLMEDILPSSDVTTIFGDSVWHDVFASDPAITRLEAAQALEDME